jgi:hypothetical protein
VLWRWKWLPPSSRKTGTGTWVNVFEPKWNSIALVLEPPNGDSPGQWSTDSARLEDILSLRLWSLKQVIGF